MDQYIWRQVCSLLRRWLDEGKDPLPVSVNISRQDILESDFLGYIISLVEEYRIPVELLRLEVTESAFAESTQTIVSLVTELINYGFTVEIDDFGSGYSSLNTLKDVPAQILKLDMKFFEDTKNTQRSGSIIESVVRMAKWLGMAVIAEGVEDKARADYLKSLGCFYIQGYYYSRPLPLAEYEALCEREDKEKKIVRLQTVDTWDNGAFWDPKSMETLVFNSYVGGACIFEYHNGKTEIIRRNEEYDQIFSGHFAYDFAIKGGDTLDYLDEAGKAALYKNIREAIAENKASSCEVCLKDDKGHFMYLRSTIRMIAHTGDRYLFYCVIVDITEQRMAEKKEKESARQLQVIIDNIDGGVTAVAIEEEGQRLLFSNDRFYKQLGYTKEEFYNELASPFDMITPNDRRRVIEEMNLHNDPGQSFSINYRAMHHDGSIRWMKGNVTTITLPGESAPVQLAVSTDITKEKENSIKMNELINAIPGGVAVYRIGKKIETVYSSDGVMKLTGVDAEEYEQWRKGDIIESAIFEGDAPKARELIMNAVALGEPINTTFRLKHKNGELIWVAFSASMIGEDVNGKVYYCVFTKPAAETALYQSLIEDSTTAAVILEKKESRIIYANPAWRRLEGVSQSVSIVGVPVSELLGGKQLMFTQSDIQNLPSEHFYDICTLSSTGRNVTVHARSTIWNGVDAYVCYITDNTRRRSLRGGHVKERKRNNRECIDI